MSRRHAALAVAFKNARRNKKRTFYLVVLIGLPVLVAVVTSAFIRAGYITPEEQATSDYGSANVKVEQWWADVGVADWTRATISELDPDAPVLGFVHDYRSFGPRLFGRVSDIDLNDPLSEGILTLTRGRVPEAVGEVVLSEHLAEELGVGVGDTATLELRIGQEMGYEVVGLASHPILWRVAEVVVIPKEMKQIIGDVAVGTILLVRAENDSEFVRELARHWEEDRYDFYPQEVEWPMPDDLYFLEPTYYAALTEGQLAETRSILEAEGEQAASDYVLGLFPNGVELGLPEVYAESRTDRLAFQTSSLTESPPVIGTAVAAVILAEVAFIAGAAFATGTRRRLREIGLMGANGADTGQVKASVVGEGLVVGIAAGILGAGAGLGLLIVGRPALQQFVERRIDGFPLTVVDLVGPIVVAVVACVIAAWLPARTASHVPTLTALQGRMPVGRPKRWVIPVGLGLTAFGTLLLGVGLATASGTGSAVALIGAVLMIGGAALLAGPIVAWVSKHAERFPITSRLVLRDSGRQRGRAAAAVSATMVILMAPVAGLAGLAANQASQAIYGLPGTDPQLLIDGGFDDQYNLVPLTDEDLAEVEGRLPGARIVRFEAIDVRVEYPAELEARKSGNTEDEGYYVGQFRAAAANDELLALLDDGRLDARLADEGMVLVGVAERETTIAIDGEEVPVPEVPVPVALYSFPRLLVTEESAARLGGETRLTALVEVDAGWFQNPFSSPFDPLWESGESFSTSGGGSDNRGPMVITLGFLATMLVVLIVVATITALSAAEADSDLQTVVAVGATNSIRRRYLALQSGLHTLIGAVLAVPLTLLLYKTAMTALGSYRSVGNFGVWDSSGLVVPWDGLALLIFGLPLAIGIITWVSVRSAPTTPPRRVT